MNRRRNKRRNRPTEEPLNESWLLPYSDKLTLLFALMVVLFSMSVVDKAKVEELAQQFIHFNLENSGSTGILEEYSPNLDFSIIDEDEIDKIEEKLLESELEVEKTNELSLFEKEMLELEALKKEIDEYISKNNLSVSLRTDITETGLLITILDFALYDSGSAYVKTEGQTLAKEISKLLEKTAQRNIVISGHTDNVPIGNANFKSNWDLSTTRATNFLEIVLKNKNLDPTKFSVKGYGEYQPIDTNDTPEGRQNNRRVEVLILLNYIREEEK